MNAETLNTMSRDSKKRYFGTVDFKKKNIDTPFSVESKRESDDVLGSFIDFDATDDKDYDITDKDLSQDYFMLNKAQSQMDVTVTSSLKNDK